MAIWDLGESTCTVFGEPWHSQALQLRPSDASQAKLQVRELLVHEKGAENSWDVTKMTELLGYTQTVSIISSTRPPTDFQRQDRLIFKLSTNGDFAVKRAYENLRGAAPNRDPLVQLMWKKVWEKGEILPRLRLFIWRLLHKALPLAKNLTSRGIRMDATCATCLSDEEDTNHMLFSCTFSRLCWFISPLAIRSHLLIGDFTEIILHYMGSLTTTQWNCFVNIIWSIWRCRNEMVYAAKAPQVTRFRQLFSEVSTETMLAASQVNKFAVMPQEPLVPTTPCQFTCYVDGSWKEGWNGGIGFVIFEDSKLISYHSSKVKSCCPIQSEAMALKAAVISVRHQKFWPCTFYTDNLTLSEACNQLQPPKEMDWRVFDEVMTIWIAFREQNHLKCRHISRNHNALADSLARKGRIEGWSITGFTFPTFMP